MLNTLLEALSLVSRLDSQVVATSGFLVALATVTLATLIGLPLGARGSGFCLGCGAVTVF
jgi:ABC-type tungstate transport system substrate-binding protein